MPETLVLCGGAPMPPSMPGNLLELDVNPGCDPKKSVDFSTDRIRTPLLDDFPDVIADLLELAAYVYCADRLTPRTASTHSPKLGAEWQRHFRFQVPVRALEVWRRREVGLALTEVLSFLSGDRFDFAFVPATAPVSMEPFLGFGDRNAQVIKPDRVVLFSGGLDSLAGVARDVLGAGEKAILVTHQSASSIMDHQNQLAAAIVERAALRQVFYAPVRVRRGAEKPREHTQRLRSFLFATLGAAYGRMFGLNKVQFYENGITSFNLPVAEHVLGTRSSRTTHPRVFAGYEKLFSLLLGETVSFENPFLWQSKADIVRTIAEHGCADLIPLTTSCANVRNYSMTGLQCGTCSQCVERRIALVAAGLENPADDYQHDIILGPIEDGRDLTMMEGHLLRAQRLAGMTQAAFLANHGQVFRAFGSVCGGPEEAARRTFELHQRYGREFIDVVERELGKHATINGLRAVAPRSLLGMLLSRHGEARPFEDATEREQASSDVVPGPELRAMKIVMAVDHKKKQIKFDDGPSLKGKSYELLVVLTGHRRSGSGETDPTDPPFMATKRLADALGTDEANLRKQIMRTREKLGREFDAATGYILDRDDVIQNVGWNGYRLNPHVIVVPIEQLVLRCPMSRTFGSDVTDRQSAH